jgi:hypothetical protein
MNRANIQVGQMGLQQAQHELQRRRFGQEQREFETTTLPESGVRVEGGELENQQLRRDLAQAMADKEALQKELEAQDIAASPEQFRAQQAVATGRQTIAQAGAVRATAETTERLAPTAERAQRKKLKTSVVLDDLQRQTAQALTDAEQPQVAAETQVAILKLQPELTQSMIDLNRAKAGGASLNELKVLALANGWTEDQFNRWAITSEQIKRAQPLLTIRQQIFKLMSDITISTGDKFAQIIAQANRPGSSLEGLIPEATEKAAAIAILQEQLTSIDNLLAEQIPEWPGIANRAASLAAPETGVGGLRREEGRTARPTGTQPPARTQPSPTGRLSQEEIRQRAAEFNQQGR